MKKILVTILLLAVPSMALAFDVNLKPGSRGEEVKKVQKFLGVEQTGFYGNGTKAAVAKFQKSKGLPASGLWLAVTRGEAKKGLSTSKETLQVATSTAAVASNMVVVATSTPTQEYVSSWNVNRLIFKIANADKQFKVKYEFTPITNKGSLVRISRCEMYSYHYSNEDIVTIFESKSYENGFWFEYANSNQKADVKCFSVDGKYTYTENLFPSPDRVLKYAE